MSTTNLESTNPDFFDHENHFLLCKNKQTHFLEKKNQDSQVSDEQYNNVLLRLWHFLHSDLKKILQ